MPAVVSQIRNFINSSALHMDRSGQHFNPMRSELDVGYITQDKYVTGFFWNGLRDNATILTETKVDAEGITNDKTFPFLLEKLTHEWITYTIALEGPLEFESTFLYNATCPFDPGITFIGTRAPSLNNDMVFLLFPHNWSSNYVESFSWLTDVITAHDGTEQRMALRTKPRHLLKSRYLLHGIDRLRFESWMSLRTRRELYTPVWRDLQVLQQDILQDDVTINIDTEGYNFAVGRTIVVWKDEYTYEVKFVDIVGDGFIKTLTPFLADWAKGAFIAPARIGVISEGREASRVTDRLSVYEISIEVNDESDLISYTPDEVYNGIPVIPFIPNYVNVSDTTSNQWKRMDNSTGYIFFDIQNSDPKITRQLTFTFFSKLEVYTFIQFIKYLHGRRDSFWISTQEHAINIKFNMSQNDNSITIENMSYGSDLHGFPQRSIIQIETFSGHVFRSSISQVQILPNFDEVLNLSVPIDIDIPLSSIKHVSWFELVRLDSDDMDVEWISTDKANIKINVVTI